ncbi:MAG: Ig-like domain-containing protein [Cystobacter sp.]
MKNELFAKWLAAVLWVLCLGAVPALAESDSFYLGDGHTGAFVTQDYSTVVNSYAQVQAPLLKGDTVLTVGRCTRAPCFDAGDLVMVLQTTGYLGRPPVGDATTVTSLNATEVGRWELARVGSVSGSTVTLRAPLVAGYAAGVTQVIRVPEYTDVTIRPEMTLTALPWDGSVGGVLAFLAKGTVRNQGILNVSGLGFRGGVFARDASGARGCSGDEEGATRGAQKGEGIANTYYGPTHTGRGQVLNGGGGGVCFRSGGGGGANHGWGGQGGVSSSEDGSRNVGGRGATVLRDYAVLNRLLLGGGGGAGHGASASAPPGGAGGGILFVRASSLVGGGSLWASGASGFGRMVDGAGGGGAGGTLHVRIAKGALCGSLDANGAPGGIPNTALAGYGGGGGGGGGGVLFFQAIAGGTCQPDANTVLGGVGSNGGHTGSVGRLETIERGFVVPAVPTVSAPAHGSFTKDLRPQVSGTAAANTTVVVFIDGEEAGRGLSNATGQYIMALSTPLSQGSHTVQVAAELDGAQSERSVANSFTVDSIAPEAPLITEPTEGAWVKDVRPPIRGTAEADSTVTLYLDTRSPVSVLAGSTGQWTYTPEAELGQGAHSVKATATDRTGNAGPASGVRTFKVDSLAPEAPSVSTPLPSSYSKDKRPLITGTAEVDAIVTVYLDGDALGTAARSGGTWSYAPTQDLGEGTHEVTARARDAAGNVSALSPPRSFTIDSVAPVAPVVSTPTEGASVKSADFAGTAEPESTVTVIVDNGVPVGVTTANALGEWSFTADGLIDGPHQVKVTATDRADNTSADSNTRAFLLDTTPPLAPVVTAPAEGARFNTRVHTLTGTAEADSTVTLFLGDSQAGTARVDDAGNWSYTTAELADGTYRVKVTATDRAGNTGPGSAVRTFTVDTAAPVAPVILAPTEGQLLTTRTPTVTGTAEAGSTVTLFLDGTQVGTALVTGSGSWSFTTAELADGTYRLTATATDDVGNTGPGSTARTFHVDATAPEAPLILAPAQDALVNTRINVITGTTEVGSTVRVSFGDLEVGTAVVDDSGIWSYTTGELVDGTYVVTVTATDAVGNVGPRSAARTFRVDATAPAAPVLLTPAEGAWVTTATPTITGTAEADSFVTVYLDGKAEPQSVQADGSGAWSYTPGAPLLEGEHSVTASATDAASNTSGVALAHTFTVDTVAPETFIDAHPPALTRDTTARFTFRSSAGAQARYLCLLDDVPLTCAATLEVSVAEGPHTLTVSSVDAAGNEDTTPASFSWVVDATAPEAPQVRSPEEGAALESSSVIVLQGTAEPDSTVTLLLDGQSITVTADAGGSWSHTLPGDTLVPGLHQVTAQARDLAGNLGAVSAPRAFTVLDSARRPDTEISSGPPATTSERDATFTFTSGAGVSFECSLDGAAFSPCSSPVTFTGLQEGTHTFQVRAHDARGFADATPASWTWSVSEADVAWLGGGCSASGDSSLVLLALGSVLAMARRRRASV